MLCREYIISNRKRIEVFIMDYTQKKYLERLRGMSAEQYEAETQTDSYKKIMGDLSVRKEFKEMRRGRISDGFKRERLLEALYTAPIVLEWLTDIQAYRDLRSEQAWVSIAMRGGDDNARSSWQRLDKERRMKHNKALKAFCKLVEKTSPGCTRDNRAPDGETFFIARDEKSGDLYDGPLMIPEEEKNGYGQPVERDSMTTGMFQLLKLIELTPKSDWDKARENTFEKLGLSIDAKVPDIIAIQDGLRRMTRGWGMDAPPDKDDFSTDLFDDRDNRYKSTKRRGFSDWDEI